MKINAINQLSVKGNNLKINGANYQLEPTDQTTAKPENVMNALHIQGMNNIAFQANPAKYVNVMKDLGKKAAIAIPLMLGAGLVTSCDPEIWDPNPIVYPSGTANDKDSVSINVEVNNEVNINIEMDQSLIAEWLKKLYEQNQISQEQNFEWQSKMYDLIKKYGEDALAYREAMLDFAAQIALSTATSAENSAEILAEIAKIKDEFEEGNITWEKALELISKINGKLDDILARLDDIALENKVYHENALKEQNKANELLEKIANGQLSSKDFNDLKEILKNIQLNVNVIRYNTQDLITIAKDPTRHEELIETIKNSKNDPIEYEKFEELFKMYGLTIADAVKMSGEELAAKLELFMEKYAANEALNQQKLDEISEKIDGLLADIAGIKSWLRNIKPSENKDYTEQINKMIDRLNKLNLLAEGNQKILNEIKDAIKNHKCECNCGDGGNHEGILGDIEDALNGLV